MGSLDALLSARSDASSPAQPVSAPATAPRRAATAVEHGERVVQVAAIEVEATDVVSVTLVDPSGEPLPPWAPGAHIDLILTPELERQYSLCGDPADRHAWRIAVLHEPESRGGSRYIHTRLQVGDTLRVRGPRNHFPLVEAEEYLLIAGGIGVTPILPMVRELAARGVRWRLVYGGRRAASMAFRDALSAYGAQVTLWPQDQHGLIDLPSWLETVRPGGVIYCCGPTPLIEAVEAACAHWPPGSLHVERFQPLAQPDPSGDTAFEVRLDYSELTVQVRADQTIVEAVEAVGIEVITSCREGTCGTCETPVLDGVPDHRDAILTPEERAANNTMMICCGRSKTPVLVLDL